LKWNKNKETKGYLLIVDDAGVVGVLWGDVRLLFVRVTIDGELDGGLDEGLDGGLDRGSSRCVGG
jgi:hypothetical protein